MKRIPVHKDDRKIIDVPFQKHGVGSMLRGRVLPTWEVGRRASHTHKWLPHPLQVPT